MTKFATARRDQVFQLSLTELAFTVVFLLLLLTGLMVVNTERERDAARKSEQAIRDQHAYLTAKEAAVAEVWTQIRLALAQAGVKDLDERLSDLVRWTSERARVEGLRSRIDDLYSRLAALEEVRRTLERVAPQDQQRTARQLAEAAIATLHGLESATGQRIETGKEFHTASRLAAQAKRSGALAAENARLKAQLAFMNRQATATGATRGFGLPPCWADESGRVQRIVDVTISDTGLTIQAAWPTERAHDVLALPGLLSMVSDARPLDFAAFRERVRPVYEWSRKQEPECRHYAAVIIAASTVEMAVRGKNLVYEMFYPAGQEALAADRR
jgi:hypothetical protein